MIHLQHITLNTGHSSRSTRDTVDAAVLDFCQRAVGRLRAGERVPVPMPRSGWVLWGASEANTLLATLSEPAGSPVVTFGVARRRRGSAVLWPLLISSATTPVQGDANRPPPTPWLASRIEIGSVTVSPQEMGLLAEVQRCMAWAWLTRRTDGGDHERRP